MAKLECHKTFPMVRTAQGRWLSIQRPYIISRHAKIAEIRELANVAISSLGWTNYFGFILFSMFNSRNFDTASAADYSNLGPLVSHKYEIIIWQPKSIPKPWIIIGYTWTRVPWHMHRRNKWWRPIRWPLMLFLSWWWKIPSSFAFQLIALFLFRYLLVFIQKLLKGRLGPIFCTTRFLKFRPIRPVWQTGKTGPVRTDMVALILPPGRIWKLFDYIVWITITIRNSFTNWAIRLLFNNRLFFIECQIWIFV